MGTRIVLRRNPFWAFSWLTAFLVGQCGFDDSQGLMGALHSSPMVAALLLIAGVVLFALWWRRVVIIEDSAVLLRRPWRLTQQRVPLACFTAVEGSPGVEGHRYRLLGGPDGAVDLPGWMMACNVPALRHANVAQIVMHLCPGLSLKAAVPGPRIRSGTFSPLSPTTLTLILLLLGTVLLVMSDGDKPALVFADAGRFALTAFGLGLLLGQLAQWQRRGAWAGGVFLALGFLGFAGGLLFFVTGAAGKVVTSRYTLMNTGQHYQYWAPPSGSTLPGVERQQATSRHEGDTEMLTIKQGWFGLQLLDKHSAAVLDEG